MSKTLNKIVRAMSESVKKSYRNFTFNQKRNPL